MKLLHWNFFFELKQRSRYPTPIIVNGGLPQHLEFFARTFRESCDRPSIIRQLSSTGNTTTNVNTHCYTNRFSGPIKTVRFGIMSLSRKIGPRLHLVRHIVVLFKSVSPFRFSSCWNRKVFLFISSNIEKNLLLRTP